MSDKIAEAESLTIDPKGMGVKTSVAKKEKFYHGGEKPKWRLEVLVGDQSQMKMKLVERNFGDQTDQMLKKWQYCRERGMPVVPFMKKTDKGNVVMPDLSADGSIFYGKGLHYFIGGGHGERRVYREADKKFLDLMSNENEVDKIKVKAQEEINRATKIGVLLPSDDPFELILKPDGVWEVIALDIEHLQVEDMSSETESDKTSRMESNNDSLNIFMTALENIKSDFKKHTTTQ